jgi:hypothetical protein
LKILNTSSYSCMFPVCNLEFLVSTFGLKKTNLLGQLSTMKNL